MLHSASSTEVSWCAHEAVRVPGPSEPGFALPSFPAKPAESSAVVTPSSSYYSSYYSTSSVSAAAPKRRWRLHFFEPTIDIHAGAATYTTAHPRILSVEYLLCLAACLYVMPYGFLAIKQFCDEHLRYYHYYLWQSSELMRRAGSVGYDDRLDRQWIGYVRQYSIFFGVAVLLMSGSMLLRRWAPTEMAEHSDSSRTVSSLSSQGNGDSFPRDEACREWRSWWHGWLRSSCRGTWPTPSTVRISLYRLCKRVWLLPVFYCIVGVIFVAIVHGPHVILLFAIILANYVVFSRLQRWCPYWLFMATMWTTHISLLYLIELRQGFEDNYWLQYLFPTRDENRVGLFGNHTAEGALWRQRMRWCVAFRMTTLRLIAFNYDLWEATHGATRARQRAADKHDTTCVECAQLREQNSAATAVAEASRCYKYRTEHPRDLADYSLVNYLAYIVFPPLYLAGPMSSFNAFVSYMRVPSTSMPLRAMLMYALRIAGIYLTEFLLLSYIHVVAIASSPFLILHMSLLEQTHYLLYSLAYMWLKFSFIWKSSRLFALFSGIEVPEDMRRCFANSFSVRDFWRDWHASFNLWIVRYMYIPMGGRPRVALSILPIFLFIALWHDPALHLVKWALCIAAMFVAELAVSACFGWACGVVQREMAEASGSRGDDDDGDAGCGAGRESGRGARSGGGGGGGVAAAVLLRLARLSARRLSPRARAWCYRMLRVVGGTCTIFGLIVANLVGFSMQNGSVATMRRTGVTYAPADAEDVIGRAVAQFSVWYALSMAFCMYVASFLAVISRDMDAAKQACLKAYYKLK